MKSLRTRTRVDGMGCTAVGLILLCAGCEGAEGPVDLDEPACSVPAAAAAAGAAVSFAQQIQPLFDTNCTICHMTDGIDPLAEFFLKLTADVSYDSIVDEASTQNSAVNLVVSGDANTSLLFQKVSMEDPPVGDRMPLCTESSPRATLTTAEIGLIRDWINQGAADN